MVKKFERGRNNSDSRINLRSMLIAEDSGMLGKGSFAEFKNGASTKSITDSEK